jgi:lipopolysaccharide/colanic/teichoic acid biosynthesis glycosyltransferase
MDFESSTPQPKPVARRADAWRRMRASEPELHSLLQVDVPGTATAARTMTAAIDAPAQAGATGLLPIPRAKRLLDVALSALGLVLSSPLWALLAAAIKLEDGGPVFYSQERAGVGGGVFRVWKFRSMVPDAERHVGALQASENDPRITRIGRLMRATAMDELPQLWSILVGDMSFVGPRALRPGEIERLGDGRLEALEDVPGYEARCRVRPGLTGVAQIYAPRDITRRHKFRYDRVYIARQGFWFDLRLILLSFWITFRGRWETRGSKV